MHLQSPCESVPTHALSGRSIAGSSGPTLAPLQTALPEGAGGTGVLAVASDEARRTLTRPLDGIAEGSVLTLALQTAAWPPVFVIAGWKVTGNTVDRSRLEFFWFIRANLTFVYVICLGFIYLSLLDSVLKRRKIPSGKMDPMSIKHYHPCLHWASLHCLKLYLHRFLFFQNRLYSCS